MRTQHGTRRALAAGLALFATPAFAAAPPEPLAVLVPEGPSRGFGWWEGDISGKRIVVGAPLAGDGGRVFIFEQDTEGAWQQSWLEPPSGLSGEFGRGLGIDGDLLAVGAPNALPSGNGFLGDIGVFEQTESGWQLLAKLPPTGPPNYNRGTDLAFSGGLILHRNGLGVSNTSEYVGTRELAYRCSPGGSAATNLDLDGPTAVVVGAGNVDGCAPNTLSTAVTDLDASPCEAVALDQPSCVGGLLRVAVNGVVVVVSPVNAVWIYQRSAAGWQLGPTLGGDGTGYWSSGVAISGPYVAVGNSNSNSVSLYHLVENSLTHLWTATSPGMGGDVMVDGSLLAAVVPANGSQGTPGSVRVYPVESDCDKDGTPDLAAVNSGAVSDCDGDLVPDSCQLAVGAEDCDSDGVLDRCEIANGSEPDLNSDGVLDRCQCLADIDGSGVVNAADLAFVLAAWGTNGGPVPQADIDGSGLVDAVDLGSLLGSWGPCPS